MMKTNSNYRQLLDNLEYLKMKQMILHLDEVVDFNIRNDGSIIDALIKLTNYEVDIREKNMIQSMVKVECQQFPRHFSCVDL
ncbi:hypothetical protein [Staphylococcus lutrae]|uniref:Uncharacterized protein n=1 Tax=Staphylococcus lutrae TaxID=155085 RepID=A0AAC9WIS7_9STAP|nr:hypothetical protein B5P37_01300 [Staphylococcus lutrae]